MTAQLDSNQKVVDFVKRAGTLVQRAEKQAAAWEQKEAAVVALIPDVVEALVTGGHINVNLREKAAQHLTDHTKTLELLASVATNKTEPEVAKLGSPVNEKNASTKSAYSNYVGAAIPEDERESGRNFMDAILGAR